MGRHPVSLFDLALLGDRLKQLLPRLVGLLAGLFYKGTVGPKAAAQVGGKHQNRLPEIDLLTGMFIPQLSLREHAQQGALHPTVGFLQLIEDDDGAWIAFDEIGQHPGSGIAEPLAQPHQTEAFLFRIELGHVKGAQREALKPLTHQSRHVALAGSRRPKKGEDRPRPVGGSTPAHPHDRVTDRFNGRILVKETLLQQCPEFGHIRHHRLVAPLALAQIDKGFGDLTGKIQSGALEPIEQQQDLRVIGQPGQAGGLRQLLNAEPFVPFHLRIQLQRLAEEGMVFSRGGLEESKGGFQVCQGDLSGADLHGQQFPGQQHVPHR